MATIKLTATQVKYMAIPMETIVLDQPVEEDSPIIPTVKRYWKTLKVPKQLDGRKVWNLQKPDNQGNCGSCWAYAGVMSLNDRYNIIGNLNLDLSVAQTVLCDWRGKTVGERRLDDASIFKVVQNERVNKEVLEENACFGNTLYDVWRHLYVWGTTTEECVPKNVLNETEMTTDEPLCATVIGKSFDMCVGSHLDKNGNEIGTPARFYRSRSFYMVPGVKKSGGSERTIRREIFKYGPVSTAMNVYEDLYLLEPDQIYKYDGKAKRVGGHAIVIVGWGEERGEKYWIIRNSWGRRWCDEGYFRIQRGTNMCDIEQNVFTGLPDFYTYDIDEPFDERSKYQRFWYTSPESVGGGRDPEFGYSRRVLQLRPFNLPLVELEPLLKESPYGKGIVVGRDKRMKSSQHSSSKSYTIYIIIGILILLGIIVVYYS